ncbi:UPF0145 domain protein [Lophiotrema nucula]|uniref:UPF0145 domain protein n=1 Tax=Lophiotrema nucula TaxID=690887 RepID=A0A6A5YHD4_9PLEO|nr:UPF0145 domain protein [Lophiotrema nucula]
MAPSRKPSTADTVGSSPPSAFAPKEEPHSFTDTKGILTTTMIDVPGYRVVKVIGTIYGLSVRTRNIGANLVTGLKSNFGGELKFLTRLMSTSRDQAVERLVNEAIARNANAIVAMKFETSDLFNQCVQCAAYGTACIVEKIET